MHDELRGPGRNFSPNAACRKLNPQLFGAAPSAAAQPEAAVAKRIRQDSKPLLNKLETRFAAWLTRTRPLVPVLEQALRFKLANGIWYKPDFVLIASPFECYEVKGPHAFRGGFENLKVAASVYPQFQWVLAWEDSGMWRFQEVLP